MSTNDPQNLPEVMLTVKLRLSKPLSELTDLVGGRLWTMDGVEDVTVSKENALPVSTQQQEETAHIVHLKEKTFEDKIRDFNKMYGLPVLEVPGFPPDMNRGKFVDRMKQFKAILEAEVNEVDDIIDKVMVAPIGEDIKNSLLTMLADWLGDIQVYCASEMRKFGLSNDMILSIIMASNMSKLGKDGKPVIVDGKVQKGPNYWKPEPLIQRYIEAAIRQADKEMGL